MRYLLLLSPLIFSSFTFHPVHLSVTEIIYKDNSFQIVHKIFVDDLEKHIYNKLRKINASENLHLNTPMESKNVEKLLNDYLRENFVIKINDKVTLPHYLGKEYETDAVWIYEEIEKISPPQKIEISDKILLEMYDDQSNFVHITINNQKQSARFEKGNITHVFNF